MVCKLLATAVVAAGAISLASQASAAPIAAPSSLENATPPLAQPVQWWGWGPYPYYSYYGAGYSYSAGYQAGAADTARCMERSYDPDSGTYLGRDRRRHPCP